MGSVVGERRRPGPLGVTIAHAAARRVLDEARQAGVFPVAVAEVGSSGGVLWQEALGTTGGTIFDLASLTKPIATTTIVMSLVANGRLSLDDLLTGSFPEWQGRDREPVTVRDLLEHASGLAARLVDRPPQGRREFEHEICVMRLEYPPRTRSVYSDLGFLLLGFLAEDRDGRSLANGFAALWPDPDLTFDLPPARRQAAAPTVPMDDDPRRGRTLMGEVHDDYAAALGGIAGHAGLFGTAGAVGGFARVVLRSVRGDTGTVPPFSPELTRQFVARSAVPGSSRALGWDTMLPTSSCGERMSAAAFGHVGFTGTSLWIDPARDRYFVLLTNRVAGHGTVDAIRDVRRRFHDVLAPV